MAGLSNVIPGDSDAYVHLRNTELYSISGSKLG